MARLALALRVGLFEAVYVAIGAWIVAGAYLDALTYVRTETGASYLTPWQDLIPHAGWLALTLWLGYYALRGAAGGQPWTRALPAGYAASLIAGLVFGLLYVLDQYEMLVFGQERGLAALASPTRLGQIVAGTVMLAAPLRAAWLRGDGRLGLAGTISAAYLLAALAFLTQFADPIRDPLARLHPLGLASAAPPYPLSWILEDLGFAAIIIQSALVAGFTLMLLRRFTIRPGTLTLALSLTGVLGASLKGDWALALPAVLTGVVGDVYVFLAQPDATRDLSLRTFATLWPAFFAGALLLTVTVAYGTWWEVHVLLGAIVAAGFLGWILSYLVFPGRRRLAVMHEESLETRRTAGAERVKDALEALDDPTRLAGSPLLDLAMLSGSRSQRVGELRELLVEVVKEVAGDRDPRDAEAGKVLFDYYVRKVGTHEVVAERNHLSRPTLFRRLQRGLELTAERIEDLSLASPRSTGVRG